MYALLGRVVFWGAVTLGAEYILKKTGAAKAIGDAVSDAGKVGTRQERKKPSAVDNLDLTKEKEASTEN